MKTNSIFNTDNIIDSRDIIERFKELNENRDIQIQFLNDLNDNKEKEEKLNKQEIEDQLIDWEEDWEDYDKWEELKDLCEQGESFDDWAHGITLIRENHFEDYCRELLADCGDLPKDLPHYIVIDWEATAKNIQMDYTSIDFGGETYYAR